MSSTAIIIVVCWILGAVLVGVVGSKRYAGFWGSFFIGLRFTPVIGLMIVLSKHMKEPPPTDKPETPEDDWGVSGWG